MSTHLNNRTVLIKADRVLSAYSTKTVITLEFPEDSPYTDQSYKDECDINTIMARYQSTGELPMLNEMEGQFLDVTEMDFQRHMDFCLNAQAMFDDLPSAIRDRFGNDPGAFLGFASDDKNRVELAKMGLLSEEATKAALAPQEPQKPAPKAKPSEAPDSA